MRSEKDNGCNEIHSVLGTESTFNRRVLILEM